MKNKFSLLYTFDANSCQVNCTHIHPQIQYSFARKEEVWRYFTALTLKMPKISHPAIFFPASFNCHFYTKIHITQENQKISDMDRFKSSKVDCLSVPSGCFAKNGKCSCYSHPQHKNAENFINIIVPLILLLGKCSWNSYPTFKSRFTTYLENENQNCQLKKIYMERGYWKVFWLSIQWLLFHWFLINDIKAKKTCFYQ